MKRIHVFGWVTAHKAAAIIVVIVLAVGGIGVASMARSGWSCSVQGTIGCAQRGEPKAPVPDTQSPYKDGEQVDITGKFVCLLHKDTSGPQTQECAYGLQTADGAYYAIRDSTPDYSLLTKTGTGVPVVVSGKYQVQAATDYQSQGLIIVDSVEPIPQ